MKPFNIAGLALKNLFQNFSRSVLTLVSLVLLSTVIISLCNFCFFYKKSGDKNLIESIAKDGVEIEMGITSDSRLEQLNLSDINEFIENAEEYNLLKKVSFSTDYFRQESQITDTGTIISLQPYLSGVPLAEDNPVVTEGECPAKGNANGILLSKEVRDKLKITLNDTLSICIDGKNVIFIVKGIVDSQYSYINYEYFKIKKIRIIDDINKYSDMMIFHKLTELKKLSTEDTYIGGYTLMVYADQSFYNKLIIGICVFLSILCIALSMGSILNTMEISVESNGLSIGIMKALGMRNSGLYLYVWTQAVSLAVFASIVSAGLAYLTARFSLETQLKTVFEIFGVNANASVIGFNFLLPLYNAVILATTTILGTLPMLKKYFKQNTITLLQEVQ